MNYFRKLNWKTVLITFCSVVVMGISIAALKLVDMGTDPYAFMNFAISESLGWSLGNWQLLMNVLLFIPVLLWGREQIGLGTVFMMVVLGYTVDGGLWLLELVGFPGWMEQMPVRIVWMLISLAVFCFSAAVYMTAGLGTSPCDAISLMIARKLRKVPFWITRFAYDLLQLLIGLMLGGKLQIVTVLTVLFLGSCVNLVAKVFFKKKM